MAVKRGSDWIPNRDDDFFTFQRHLIDKVVANKAAWGIPDAVVNPLTARRAEYEPLYHKAQEKKDRTAGDVDRHRQSRKIYEKELRQFINSHIRYNAAVPRDNKIEMGVPPRDTEPSPRPEIRDIPTVGFEHLGGGSIRVICRRATDQTRPSIHPDADAVECRFILLPKGEMPARPEQSGRSGGPPKSSEDCPGIQVSKKAKFIIECGVKNAGQHFYGFFRWVNLTNTSNNGPWSNAKSTVIA